MWLQSKLLAFAALGGQKDVAEALCKPARALFQDGSDIDPDIASAALMVALNNPDCSVSEGGEALHPEE